MVSQKLKQAWLLITNTLTSLHWWYVLYLFLSPSSPPLFSPSSSACIDRLTPAVFAALVVSTLELVNSLTGLTRSKPYQVLIFASARWAVARLIAPLIPCTAWMNLATCCIWGLGDGVRFGCFALDAAFSMVSKEGDEPPHGIKTVRYTVGPLLFPLGVVGEMGMVLKAAGEGRPMLYAVAMIWPLGFFPLMKQLMKQRARHMAKLNAVDDKGSLESKVKLF